MHFVPSVPELVFLFFAMTLGFIAAVMFPRSKALAIALVFCPLLATLLSPADLLSTCLLTVAFIFVLQLGRRLPVVQEPLTQ